MTALYIFSSFTREKSTAVLLKKGEFPKDGPNLARPAKYVVLLQSKCYYLGTVPSPLLLLPFSEAGRLFFAGKVNENVVFF